MCYKDTFLEYDLRLKGLCVKQKKTGFKKKPAFSITPVNQND